jgi:hypothetical protein
MPDPTTFRDIRTGRARLGPGLDRKAEEAVTNIFRPLRHLRAFGAGMRLGAVDRWGPLDPGVVEDLRGALRAGEIGDAGHGRC